MQSLDEVLLLYEFKSLDNVISLMPSEVFSHSEGRSCIFWTTF